MDSRTLLSLGLRLGLSGLFLLLVLLLGLGLGHHSIFGGGGCSGELGSLVRVGSLLDGLVVLDRGGGRVGLSGRSDLDVGHCDMRIAICDNAQLMDEASQRVTRRRYVVTVGVDGLNRSARKVESKATQDLLLKSFTALFGFLSRNSAAPKTSPPAFCCTLPCLAINLTE
ncbi:hypothetical protein KCU73_g106, partial [Aureobasidium melanogenum]